MRAIHSLTMLLTFSLSATVLAQQPIVATPTTALVRFKSDVSAKQVEDFKAQYGATSSVPVGSDGSYKLVFPKLGVEELADKLQSDPRLNLYRTVKGDYREIFQDVQTQGADLPSGLQDKIAKLRKAAGDPKNVRLVALKSGEFSLNILRNGLGADAGFIDQGSLKLNIIPGMDVTAVRNRVSSDGTGSYRWSGTLSAKQSSVAGADVLSPQKTGTATLTISEGEIIGRISVGRDVYTITPLENGYHAITRVDQSKLPPEHPSSYLPATGVLAPISLLPSASSPMGDAPSNLVHVAVAISKSVADTLVVSPARYASSLVDTVNSAFENSGVDGRLAFSGARVFDYSEVSFDTDIEKFIKHEAAPFSEIAIWRKQAHAEVLVVITSLRDYCGLAGAILANFDTAVALVSGDCALSNLSFAHEVGHLFGARHNPEEDSSALPFAWGHGRLFSEYRTIMAYPGASCASPCPRIPWYGGPEVIYQGAPLGNATLYNEARVIRDTFSQIAHLVPAATQ